MRREQPTHQNLGRAIFRRPLTVEALRDGTAGAILREGMRLPDRDRRIILGIVRRFRKQARGAPDGR
jgi:hypothetical protein